MAESRLFQQIRSEPWSWRLAALGAFLALIAWQFMAPRERGSTTRPIPAGRQRPAEPVQHCGPDIAFESSDWPLSPVALIYLGAIALLVISALVLIVAYPSALPDADRTLHIAPPGPRLETDSAADLQRLRAEEDKRLNTYYWVDKNKGLVHIPIEQAMKKLATTGLSGFPKVQQ